MTGYFVWIETPKGSAPQKWALDSYHVEIAARSQGQPRPRILATHFLDEVRWKLTIDELSKIYQPPT